jgi:prepilin-type N-terminal cleavage/methylation domain-containing protein
MVLISITGRVGMIFRKGVSGMPGVDDKGFTLVEVMIAIFFFLAVAFAITSMNIGTWYNTYFSRSTTEASILAAQQLEELISRKFAGYKDGGMDDKIRSGDHPFISDDGRYTGVCRIKDNVVLPQTKAVQVTVSFTTHDGKTKTLRYNYLIPLRK